MGNKCTAAPSPNDDAYSPSKHADDHVREPSSPASSVSAEDLPAVEHEYMERRSSIGAHREVESALNRVMADDKAAARALALADAMHCSEGLRFLAALTALKQLPVGSKKRTTASESILREYVRQGARWEQGCIPSGLRNQLLTEVGIDREDFFDGAKAEVLQDVSFHTCSCR